MKDEMMQSLSLRLAQSPISLKQYLGSIPTIETIVPFPYGSKEQILHFRIMTEIASHMSLLSLDKKRTYGLELESVEVHGRGKPLFIGLMTKDINAYGLIPAMLGWCSLDTHYDLPEGITYGLVHEYGNPVVVYIQFVLSYRLRFLKETYNNMNIKPMVQACFDSTEALYRSIDNEVLVGAEKRAREYLRTYRQQ